MQRNELREKATQLIASWQDKLDQAIAAAARERFEQLQQLPNLPYDIRKATDEAWGLSIGKDLRYDRPSTGMLYGLWYHPQRVTTCLPQVLDSLLDANLDVPLVVFDLGAGTGAFQWAVALCAAAIQELAPARQHAIHIVNVDSSAIMLTHLEDLWSAFRQNLPAVADHVSHEISINSYSAASSITTEQIWITASYLFDHTDKVKDVVDEFSKLIKQAKPSRVLLSTSSHKGAEYLPSIRKMVMAQTDRKYVEQASLHGDFFNGPLPAVNAFRGSLATYAGYPHRIGTNARWKSTYHRNLTLVAAQTELAVATKATHVELEMFRPELPQRTKLVLSAEQEDACKLGAQSIGIFGSAGSGKSVILSERIKRLVEEQDYDFKLRILVTTFNKKLVTDVLCRWLIELLDPTRIYHGSATDGSASISFKSRDGKRSGKPNIQLYNFDKLPTRIGKVGNLSQSSTSLIGSNSPSGYEQELQKRINASVDSIRDRLGEYGTSYSAVKHVLNARYVEEDLHRMVYGKSYTTEQTFMQGERSGRRLDKDAAPRRVLWATIQDFKQCCARDGKETFLDRRATLRDLCQQEKFRNIFTHIFVDELQDCGDTDFEIFFSLIQDPNNLCVTGDLAQAVHLGKSSSSYLPRYNHFFDDGHPADKVQEQSNWKYTVLQGSFRLPFRISEALIPLSQSIATKRSSSGSVDKDEDGKAMEVVLQHPYKGSPPGVRIIIVAAPTSEAMAEKIISIRSVYCRGADTIGFDESAPIIMQHDEDLQAALSLLGTTAETDTILRLKGLEYSFVIWSTRAPITSEEDFLEYAYTILTRSSGMAVIALFPDPSAGVKEVLATFHPDEIILWDAASEGCVNAAGES